jgi:DNA polymerase-3 subunit gamma/tau
VHKVPTTIISRCQRFDFKRISVSDVVKKLNYIVKAEEIKINKNILEAIARHSEGYMRDAESILGQIIAIAGREVTQEEADLVIPRSDISQVINLINFLVKKDAGGAIRLINKLVDDGVDLKIFLKELIEILRKIMLTKINPALVDKLAIELGENIELKINQTSQDLTLDQVLIYLERFIKVLNELKGEFIEQLPIELAIAEFCSSQVTAKTIPLSPVSTGAVYRFIPPEKRFDQLKVNPQAPVTNFNITYEQILEKWHEVLARVKQYNHSLSFILRVCQPKNLTGNQLCLAFKYKFHKDRVSQANIKNLVEKILQQTFGQPIMVEAVIDENLEVAASKLVSDEPVDQSKGQAVSNGDKPDMINDLLKTFGGKIVK